MKKIFIVLVLFLISNWASAIDVSITNAQFKVENSNYLEIYFHYLGTTVNQIKTENGNYQASLEVLILLKQENEIRDFRKFNLTSPENIRIKDFQDVRRFALKDGSYQLEISILDLNDQTNSFNHKETILSALGNVAKPSLSDVQLISSFKEKQIESNFTKNGFTYEVLPYDYLDSKYDKINFYVESYHPDTTNVYFLKITLLKGFKSSRSKQLSQAIKKLDKQSVVPILKTIEIGNLPSGNYHLKVELINNDKEVLDVVKKDFNRSNPYMDFKNLQKEDNTFSSSFVHFLETSDLDYYLKAHKPIAENTMSTVLNEVIGKDNERNKRYFLHKYWASKSKTHGKELFQKYMEIADAIDEMYNSGFGHGFETDRGYIYLKYGRPSQSIKITDDPSAPPYEMWVYDKLYETQQNNVKFVFYSPSLSNEFKLLHSTCLGELSNLAWEIELYRDAITEDNGFSVDQTTVKENYNRRARQLFEDL